MNTPHLDRLIEREAVWCNYLRQEKSDLLKEFIEIKKALDIFERSDKKELTPIKTWDKFEKLEARTQRILMGLTQANVYRKDCPNGYKYIEEITDYIFLKERNAGKKTLENFKKYLNK